MFSSSDSYKAERSERPERPRKSPGSPGLFLFPVDAAERPPSTADPRQRPDEVTDDAESHEDDDDSDNGVSAARKTISDDLARGARVFDRLKEQDTERLVQGARLLSSDSHVVEPLDLWQERLPVHLRERAPRGGRCGDAACVRESASIRLAVGGRDDRLLLGLF